MPSRMSFSEVSSSSAPKSLHHRGEHVETGVEHVFATAHHSRASQALLRRLSREPVAPPLHGRRARADGGAPRRGRRPRAPRRVGPASRPTRPGPRVERRRRCARRPAPRPTPGRVRPSIIARAAASRSAADDALAERALGHAHAAQLHGVTLETPSTSTASSVEPPPTSTMTVESLVIGQPGRRARVGVRRLLVPVEDPYVDTGASRGLVEELLAVAARRAPPTSPRAVRARRALRP